MTSQILGVNRLPWEGGDASSQLLQRAGKLRTPVLELLARNPVQRLDVEGFLAACSRVLAVTTQQSPPVPGKDDAREC